MTSQSHNTTIGGKISIVTTLLGVLVIFLGLVIDKPHSTHVAHANLATTSVTVLNTPPQWAEYPHESATSSTSTPTNVGTVQSWRATASDSSNDNYFLIICKTSDTPVPHNNGSPDCGGGLPSAAGGTTTWAKSATTSSGVEAVAATTTTEGTGSQFNAEFNNWFAWVCDGNSTGAACIAAYSQGQPGSGGNDLSAARSPFVVNHRPTFSVFINTSPANPGGTVTWYSTSSDPDSYGGASQDTVRLFVCKAADFTGTACGPGGSWATTTGPDYMTADATATILTLPNPQPDGTFGAYGYVIDSHGGLAASGGKQGSTSSLTVNNITPTISAASISLNSATGTPGTLILLNIATQTPSFSVQYTVADQNSCRTASSTREIQLSFVNVYRSGITQTGCDTAAEYNANNCYPGATASTSVAWNMVCTASSTSCLGTSDSDEIWTCTFPFWYIADATDVGSQFAAQNWLASAQATDNNGSASSLVESSVGSELLQFLAYSVSTSTIAYGGLQPGQDTGTVGNTVLDRTDVLAGGNVGLDETLYGTDMCVGYPAPCSGLPQSTIFVANQRYAFSSQLYSAATTLLASPGVTEAVHIPKSTATSTQNSTTTYWGIAVPGAITVSGDYLGQNTIIGVTSNSSFW